MKHLYLVILLLFCLPLSAQIVNIPDAHFKTALLNHAPAIDINADGEIQVTEALSTAALDLNYNIYDAISLTGIEAFANLTSLNCSNGYNLTDIDVSMLNQLEYLNLSSCYDLASLNVAGLSNLESLLCDNNHSMATIDLSGLTNLKTLNMSWCHDLSSVDVSQLTALETLNCSYSYLSELNVSGLTNLKHLMCENNQISTLDIAGQANLETLQCDSNNLTTLDVASLTNLTYLKCSNNSIETLDVTNLVNLTYLGCSSNSIAVLDVANLANLVTLDFRYNMVEEIHLTNLPNLTTFYAGGNQLTALDFSSQGNLEYIDCHANLLTELDMTPLTNLLHIDCGQNNIASLDVSQNTNMKFLACAGNELTTLDLSALTNLTDLICSSNHLTELDFTGLTKLGRIEVGWNLFTALDFSPCNDVENMSGYYYSVAGNPNLVYLNMKNGSDMSFMTFTPYGCENLQYVCADEQYITAIQNDLIDQNLTDVVVNSYCSFTPGGTFNTIEGTASLDYNSNGCEGGDPEMAGVKISINDGTTTGATFTNATGGYSFFTESGTYTLTPVFENPYFTISPASATINFAEINAAAQTQPFCISPNGVHNDLEITLLQTGPARPGFDANYQLVCKNKGNQVADGTVLLEFNDDVLDFISAVPMTDSQSAGTLNWNYASLMPFETRYINFTLNVNSPMEVPAVNIDDILVFTSTIGPVSGDETAQDNIFNMDQTVVGSMDPNDKTCLEGATITPSEVGSYLHYLIRFQNSGTFLAENVVVRDMIDTSKFDLASLQITSTSHTQTTRVTDNKVEFIFTGINLPAEQDNEPGSHGFVAFKVRTKNNLVLGNTVSNTADIFFDYNFPITTNTALTTVSMLGIGEHENLKVSVSPNPVRNLLSIKSPDEITSVQLFDFQGRILQTWLSGPSIDLSENASGIYFIKVTTSNGIKVEKIIKE